MNAKALLQLVFGIWGALWALGSAWAEGSATLDAAATAPAGSQLQVRWTGPHRRWDRIGLLKVGAPDSASAGDFSVPVGPNPVSVLAPEEPGEYELRYLARGPSEVLARRTVTVLPVTATLQGPASAVAGAQVSVEWTGPNNRWDRIGIVKVGTPDRASSGKYSVYTGPHPLRVTAPAEPGEYEIRYVTGNLHLALAKAPLLVTRTEATLKGPGSAAAGSRIRVDWQGPGNRWDRITVAPKGSPEDQWTLTSYAGKHAPTALQAPLEVGEYELRYQNGQTGAILARDALQITPASVEPGQIRVRAARHGLGTGGAVEVILDTSGSMLQRIGAERRIDIAKRTLKNLTTGLIPAGTPFALRVFGRRANSCETELEIPLGPLDAAAIGSRVDALSAQSDAKTPIGASLEKVAADLSGVKGERLVILVTDGEETCGGSPASAIEKLRKGGVNLRVNIVGFAVEDRKTAALFRQWSVVGNGGYFDARDAAGLNEALSLAVRPAFEVVDAKQKVVADGITGGEPVSVLPGKYSVRLKGGAGRPRSVSVRPQQISDVEL